MQYTQFSENQVYAAGFQATEAGHYLAYIRGARCKTETDFFREVSAAFQFPKYFGENWPAVDECLCDLEWLHVQGIYVIVDDFSLMFRRDKRRQTQLVKYLQIMEAHWTEEQVPIEILLNN